MSNINLSKIPASKKSAARRPFPRELFTKSELKVLAELNSPAKINNCLESLPYDPSDGYRSVRQTLRIKQAHCAGGALLAAACLWYHGLEPTLVSLEAQKDDSHFICVYQINGYWGALSKSNFTTLRSRDPVFKTLRELVMSYWNFYFNLEGYKSLRTYTRPITLASADRNTEWLIGENEDIDWVDDRFDDKKEYDIVPKSQIRFAADANKTQLGAALLGANHAGLYKPT